MVKCCANKHEKNYNGKMLTNIEKNYNGKMLC